MILSGIANDTFYRKGKRTMKEISLLFTIIRRKSTEKVLEMFSDMDAQVNYVSQCNGTATMPTLSLFGLEHTEKSLIISVTSEKKAQQLSNALKDNLLLHLPDTGVTFTVPISSLDSVHTLEYISHDEEIIDKYEEDSMKIQNELIIAICEAGYTDLVMDAARSAGATGGTTIKAKGTGAKRAEKFFGVSIAEEKELVLIVTQVKLRNDIMKAIRRDAGVASKAHAYVISLPVTNTEGFNTFDSDEDF